jgi:hypothetical protein
VATFPWQKRSFRFHLLSPDSRSPPRTALVVMYMLLNDAFVAQAYVPSCNATRSAVLQAAEAKPHLDSSRCLMLTAAPRAATMSNKSISVKLLTSR